MDRVEAAGCDELSVQIVPGHEDALERWADVFDLRLSGGATAGVTSTATAIT